VGLLSIAIGVALLATIWSLVCGVSAMATGHEILHHSSDEWMFRRVGFQAVTIALLLVALAIAG
jgi:Hypoxia induced protein conserved region